MPYFMITYIALGRDGVHYALESSHSAEAAAGAYMLRHSNVVVLSAQFKGDTA